MDDFLMADFLMDDSLMDDFIRIISVFYLHKLLSSALEIIE